jgi:integrase
MASLEPIDAAIAVVNARLKAARLGLQVDRRGQTLALRGTLPPRPGSTKTRPHQQRIPIGLPATKAGLKQIEQDAKVIAARLIERSFDWSHYCPRPRHRSQPTPAWRRWSATFNTRCWIVPGADEAARAALKSTWAKAYAPYLRKLMRQVEAQPQQPLAEAIMATVESLPAQARSRQVGCTALKAFAEHFQIDLPQDLDGLWGSYGPSKTQRRALPSDADIVTWYERIPNPAWRFVYGIMATYGLRNHEVFFCDYSGLTSGDLEGRVTVLETTKTGLHDVWPFYPDWIDRFRLGTVLLPQVNTDLSHTTLQRIGQRVSTQFKRYQVPFSPYDLRHAWAVRTIHFGLPDTVAARMMGHSVAIHNRTYHRWITRRISSRR